MAKHLSEDEVTLVVNAKADKAQQNIRKFSKEIDNLGERNKSLQRQMESLELAGKKNTDSWKQRREEYRRNSTQIRNLKQQIAAETKALDLNALTMAQLRQQARSLQRQLDNTSKTINPEDWKKLSSRLSDVRERMGELSDASKSFVEKYNNPQTMSFFRGELFIRFAELAGKALQKVKEFAAEGISMAETADGVIHAFEKIGTEDYLQTLRDATKGTVSDIELMKAAVKAKDFRIPLEDLGKYLSFAQLKAQQTGQSLDYMVDSIVTGLGRQSPQILDNLGLSASEISEKTKETGDFMKGVASIVEKNLAEAGETYISAADRAAQRTIELENAQLALGKALLPIKEEFTDIYGQIQVGAIKAIKYLVEHRNTLVLLTKAVVLLTATYTAYVAGQKLSYLWSLRAVAVSKIKAAAAAVENTMLQLSVLRHAVLNKTMKTSIALQKAFNIVLKLSPWGVILGAITLVVGALLMFNKRADAATIAQKKLNDIQSEASRKVEEERIKIEMLTKRIHDNSLSLAERQGAIEALQKIVPDYTAKLSHEGKVYDENTQALTRYLNALKEKALLEGAQNALKELGEKKAKLIIQLRQQEQQLKDMKKEQAQFQQQNAGRPQTTGGAYAPTYVGASMGYSGEVGTLSRQLQKTKDEIKVVDASMNAIGKEFGKKMFSSSGGSNGGSGAKKGTIGTELGAVDAKIEGF